MKCIGCKIEINNLTDNCPICGKHLHSNGQERQPAYINIEEMEKKARINIIKSIKFITIVFSFVILLINLLTSPGYLWSLLPISSVWLLWLIVFTPIIKRKITPFMITVDSVVISAFLIAIDFLTTKTAWSITYVVPFILFGSAFIVTIIIMLNRMTWRKFYMFQLAIGIICIIPVIARLFIEFILWPSLISGVYGVVTIIGMLIFGDKTFKNEAKKRLHI